MRMTEKEQIARNKVCLPLDGLRTLEDVKKRIEELHSMVGLFKIGKELFTRFGPEVVQLVHKYETEVFLDLKFHDIPNTVKGAAYVATQLGVYMFNVHASGGFEMMKAAVVGAQEASHAHKLRMPKMIAVTVLTSIDTTILNHELRIPGEVDEQVLHLAQFTQQAGLDGIVCSATDLESIKQQLPADFLYVTPGIKGPRTTAGSDQKRVFTPQNAIKAGASILVIGRAITAADDKCQAAQEVLQDMAEAL